MAIQYILVGATRRSRHSGTRLQKMRHSAFPWRSEGDSRWGQVEGCRNRRVTRSRGCSWLLCGTLGGGHSHRSVEWPHTAGVRDVPVRHDTEEAHIPVRVVLSRKARAFSVAAVPTTR